MNREYTAFQSKLLYCQDAQNQIEASKRKFGELTNELQAHVRQEWDE